MQKNKLLIFFFFFLSFLTYSQQKDYWKINNQKLVYDLEKRQLPKDVKIYDLEENIFRNKFKSKKKLFIDFPNAEGKIITYNVEETSIMHPDLAKKYNMIKSFRGISTVNPLVSIRFTISSQGVYAVIYNGGKSSEYINPISKNGYAVFKRSQAQLKSTFECLVQEQMSGFIGKSTSNKLSGDLTLRTFELALATTGEYSQFHIGLAGVSGGTDLQKKEAVMNAVVVAINRVNEIFERDLAVTLQLIPNTDLLFYLDGVTDPYSNGDGPAMLGENQANIDNVIGSANYDIGHVFSTGGGGIALLQSPCGSGKARGVTGQPNPIGDPFSVDYVAHELGHQFGANHTFNGTADSCGNNRNDFTAVEPGSGSTIMSYAGLCAPQNIQPLVNDYFNTISIQEMTAFITSASANCDDESMLINNLNSPSVDAGPDFTVPKSTPLILKGIANDVDGDALTYAWEQVDSEVVGISSPPSPTQTQGAVFRSLPPTNSLDRYLPDLNTVLSGNLTSTWEVLPSVGRTMDFTLTVRDNVMGGGQVGFDDMRITVANDAGPFFVTSQNDNEVFWAAGTQETITWNVANTNIAPVNSPNVNIVLSLDGGLTYPISLATNIPNNGSAVIMVPDTNTANGRIKIEGANHIFYAVNRTNINITNDFALSVSDNTKKICSPENAIYNLSLNFATGFNETVSLSAENVPSGASASFNPSSSNTTSNVIMTLTGTENVIAGSYTITIVGAANTISRSSQIVLEVFNDGINSPVLSSPINGANNVLASGTSLQWNADENVEEYTIEIATNASFTSIIESAVVDDTSYVPLNLIDATTYYWRVKSSNLCASSSFSEVNVFTTSEIVCNSSNATNLPISIPDDNSTGVNSIINIAEDVVINDINVSVNINHTWMRDLIITLESPSGKVVKLLERQCRGNLGNVNMNATFDDEGVLLECANSSPVINGTIKATELLSLFNGESSQGDWILNVSDVAAEDIGSLNSWSIEICESKAVAGVEREVFGDLSVWPNPTNEDINIVFTSFGQENTIIKLYDTLGRLIIRKEYQTESVIFNEHFSVQNFSSGMYFIEISKGKNVTTKRLIKI